MEVFMSIGTRNRLGFCALALLALACLAMQVDNGRRVYQYSVLLSLHIDNESRCAYVNHEGKTIKAKDMVDLGRKIGVKAAEGGLYATLNYLGSKGWSLVAIEDQDGQDGKVHSYYLERCVGE
jgi:hypothetical protein